MLEKIERKINLQKLNLILKNSNNNLKQIQK